MLADLLGQTCQIFRPSKLPNRFGDQKDSWPATPMATVKCRLQQVTGSEDADGRDLSVGVWKLFLPADAQVSEHDRVRVGGKDFEVTSVYPVHRPSGLHHYELRLTTFSGGVTS